jgi:large subunit ribosomal protein L3
MARGILGRKVGMTSIFGDDGTAISVTVLEAGPCDVLQTRTQEKDGYSAVQLGFSDKPRRLARRSERGHVGKLASKRSKLLAAKGVEPSPRANCEPKRWVREFRNWDLPQSVGDVVKVEILADSKAVDVTGISKGRGFAGVMKRHKFSGQRASHGVKKVHRHLGSAGCSAFPSRTMRGKRMPGQYGNATSTARNLKVVKIIGEQNLLLVRGAVPGPNGGFVKIRSTNKLGS